MKIIITRKEIRAKFNIPSDIDMQITGDKKKSKKGRKKGATKANGYKLK